MDELRKNCCRILEISPDSSKEEIEEAFERIKAEVNTKKEGWERLKEANWAYDTLMDNIVGAAGKEGILEKEKIYFRRQKDTGESDVMTLKDILFSAEEKVNPFFFAGRVLVFLIIIIWGFKYMTHSIASNYAGESFLHNVNLPFHEAGHIIFSLLGEFMGVFGGSLLQILIPLICMGALLKHKDVFGASIALWWTGQNFIDIAPYINDARAQELILLGGVTGRDVPGFHDWNNILGRLGLLKLDHVIANMSHWSGVMLMIISFLWGGYLLYLNWRNMDR